MKKPKRPAKHPGPATADVRTIDRSRLREVRGGSLNCYISAPLPEPPE